ncbi:hypothetical protein [Actinomadura rubrisoli]|uniref:Uncharacterized protein n=1 Tax=Actinomadura rubrisoli TaxID=2530368 RepID=A0A4R5CH42_9ACTN|nr:hypothetical protein [Actinomadura rubrisoli]TDD97613.1 hypothetical protein E1298_00860 [Actinomadura rubrisoli]
MTDSRETLAAIDTAVDAWSDYDETVSNDAMRWAPEPPVEDHPHTQPRPRIEAVEVRVRTSDGVEHIYTMPDARDVTIDMDLEDPYLDDPWSLSSPAQFVGSLRVELFSLTVRCPREVNETRREI